jgi:hypothetical protein
VIHQLEIIYYVMTGIVFIHIRTFSNLFIICYAVKCPGLCRLVTDWSNKKDYKYLILIVIKHASYILACCIIKSSPLPPWNVCSDESNEFLILRQ